MARFFQAVSLAVVFLVPLLAPGTAAAANWGAFKRDACVGVGKRQYSSRLGNIQGDWMRACQATGARVAGQRFPRPSRCRNLGIGGMWGEFDVSDASCKARWGQFKRDACVGAGVRQYSSRLSDIPGKDWVQACRVSQATVGGQTMLPTRCRNLGVGGMWGEFDVKDTSCQARWGDFKRDACVRTGVRQYSSRLWDIPGKDWVQACRGARATIAGRSTLPSRCNDLGVGGMWGEFDVPDDSCPYWGNELGRAGVVRAGCVAVNLRKHYARLWDVPAGVDWLKACRSEPQNVAGYATPWPSACVSKGPLGMWGEWLVKDKSCTLASLPQDARRQQIATTKLAELGHVIASKVGFARQVSTNRNVMASLKGGGSEQRIAQSVNLSDAAKGEQPDGYLLRTLTVGATVGTKVLIFGVQGEAGAAIDLKGKRPVYAYAAGGYEWGVGLAAGGGVNVGFWVCQNNKIGGDIWGMQFGLSDLVKLAKKKASLEKGPSFGIALWFDYRNTFQGFTLTPGFGVGADFVSVLVYATTAVDGDETVQCDGRRK
jgi:hypothetical protein